MNYGYVFRHPLTSSYQILSSRYTCIIKPLVLRVHKLFSCQVLAYTWDKLMNSVRNQRIREAGPRMVVRHSVWVHGVSAVAVGSRDREFGRRKFERDWEVPYISGTGIKIRPDL